MTSKAEQHLARASEYIEAGDEFYRKAKPEIESAIAAGASQVEVARFLARSRKWVQDVIAWDGEGTLYAKDTERRQTDQAKQVLRESSPDQIADLLAAPEVRAKVRQADTIATNRAANLIPKEASEAAFRQSVGEDAATDLDNLQTLRDISAELTKARVALNGTLHSLNDVGLGNLPDSWREEYLRAFEDIAEKCDLGRGLLTGALDAELEEILEAGR